MDTIRRWWQAQCRAWEALHRAHAPWEQEGPLRWVRRYGAGWELHGATVPDNASQDAPEDAPAAPHRGRRFD